MRISFLELSCILWIWISVHLFLFSVSFWVLKPCVCVQRACIRVWKSSRSTKNFRCKQWATSDINAKARRVWEVWQRPTDRQTEAVRTRRKDGAGKKMLARYLVCVCVCDIYNWLLRVCIFILSSVKKPCQQKNSHLRNLDQKRDFWATGGCFRKIFIIHRSI